MIKRVVCLILLVLTFVMIPTNIGARSHPLPSGRLTGEELAMGMRRSVRFQLRGLKLSYLSACQIVRQGPIEFSLKSLSSILTMKLESNFIVEQMKVDNLEESQNSQLQVWSTRTETRKLLLQEIFLPTLKIQIVFFTWFQENSTIRDPTKNSSIREKEDECLK